MRREECADDKMDSDRRRVVVHSHAAPKLQPYILRTTAGHRNPVSSRLSCPSVPYTTTRFTRSSCLLHVILAETSAASTSGISA